jgi:hypothetical protein
MEQFPQQNKIAWQTHDNFHNGKKTNDWFWGLWIIIAGGIILSFYFGNVLFGIILLLFAITAGLMANKKPELLQVEITRKGVKINDLLFPYSTLESFWVDDGEVHDKVLLKSTKAMQPFIVIPFDSTETDPELIRDYLLDYLDEEELEEPFLQKLMETLGF